MFSLNFRELWASVNGYLTDELDQIVASAQAAWNAQHTASGSHRDVTADSVTSGLLFGGRLGLSESTNTTAIETVTGDPTYRVLIPSSPAAIVNVVPDTTADTYLWALSTAGRSIGEVVILRAKYDFGLTHFGFIVRSNSSLTAPSDAAKFLILGDGTGTNYDAITMQVGESLLVRLENAQPTSTSSFSTYWRVLGKLQTV